VDYSSLTLERYSREGVIVDSNLLLLVFTGVYDRQQIGKTPRLERYTEADFDLLIDILKHFKRLVTTAHVLTEVSNLSIAIPESQRKPYFAVFAAQVELLDEHQISASTALQNKFARFGLSDAAIAGVAQNHYLVLTDDFKLSNALQGDGIDALNFNHLREANWRMGSQ
jgi:rRNA-processing protein FCF1